MSTASGDDSAVRPIVALVSALGLGAGGLLFGYLLVFLVAGIISVAGVKLSATMLIVLGIILVQGVGCIGIAFSYVRLRPRVGSAIRGQLGLSGGTPSFQIGASLPSFRELLIVVGGYIAAFIGATISIAIASILQVDTGQNEAVREGMKNPELLLFLIPASVLLIGPGEEMLFRGIVQGRLREVFSPVVAIGIASTVFAGIHWFSLTGGSPSGNLVALAILVVPAVVFGMTYEYTGNIVVPSLIHGIYNATIFSLVYVSVIYGEQTTALASVVEAGGFL